MVIDENYHHYVDLAFALLEDKPGYYSINENINLENADWTAPIFSEEHIATFDSEYNFDHYFVFGRTRFSKCLDTNGHPFIFSIPTCHCDMECISLLNDGYYCLKTTEDINIEEWRGISGAPVITQNGELLGIACAVFEEGKSFFVMDIHKVLPFLDIEILERNNK